MIRVGVFGLLGAGNIGNEGSFEALLGYLCRDHPGATVDVMGEDPAYITNRHGLPATRLNWNRREYETAEGPVAIARKAFGKIVDIYRTAAWVRRHDVVIIPGMGVLEAVLPIRPWGFPYSLFLLCLFGRLLGVNVALVSVGADTKGNPATRWLQTSAARMAHYRSYRDSVSKDAMKTNGVDVSRDEVFPDLAFAIPTPSGVSATGTVGLGVIYYRGTNDERQHADQVYSAYIGKIKTFARWLVDHGYRIRLLIGDLQDQRAADDVIAELRSSRPDIDPSWVIVEPIWSLDDLMRQVAQVEFVVAARYHNILCAVKALRPTISTGYGAKNDSLMLDFGLGEYRQSVQTLDVEQLISQFSSLESQWEKLREVIAGRMADIDKKIDQQFRLLSTELLAPTQSR